MITIEKVAILRSIPLFTSIPDHVLAAVAQITDEVDLADGETLIREGDVGDCMYIIVDGNVRVHSRNKTIITLSEGQTVGELAVFDPEPRSASATAEGVALLFRIGKDAFDEVMADRPEIASGVIHALSQRVREQGRLMASQSGGTA